MRLNELLCKFILAYFFLGEFLRVVNVNVVFGDDSEDFCIGRAIKVVNINVPFEYVIWEHNTTNAIWLINFIHIIECFENFFMCFINTNSIINSNLAIIV